MRNRTATAPDLDAPPIPLCVPEIGGNAWVYLKECLDTGWVSSVGRFVDRFEESVVDFLGGGGLHGVAAMNGTSALHVALRVAGVEPDDEVIVPTLTFIAPANAVRYAGAWPVFCDVEPEHWQIDPERLVRFLERDCRVSDGQLVDRQSGRRVRALLPVHLLGHPVDMDPLLEVARRYDLLVVEDASESLGAAYRGAPTGTVGDIACFSFNANKVITCGGGGMIVTRNVAWAEHARHLTTQAKIDEVESAHGEIGFNYRLTNLQAALGCSQMELLPSYLAAKRGLRDRYRELLADVPGIALPDEADWARDSAWLTTVRVEPTRFGLDRRTLAAGLAEARIQTRPLWEPMHRSRAHAGARVLGGEVAAAVQESSLSLPSSVGLSLEGVERVVARIAELGRTPGPR